MKRKFVLSLTFKDGVDQDTQNDVAAAALYYARPMIEYGYLSIPQLHHAIGREDVLEWGNVEFKSEKDIDVVEIMKRAKSLAASAVQMAVALNMHNTEAAFRKDLEFFEKIQEA